MSATSLRPWTELTRLHPDVEAGTLAESVYALDLGAIAAGDRQAPAVYRDAQAFFRATYLTADLTRLLEEVLASLAGRADYNRVLKLRTAFGGGKSHTLVALLHAARDRAALDAIPEGKGFADPGDVAVAVFDGEKFDAYEGKTLPDGRTIRTMWGWIAWQIDPERAFPLVAGHDADRVAPGGDKVREVLTIGARGRPVLILLDELLKYMERAGAVGVGESTLQRQAKDFFQNLTVEVAASPNAALVYSLTMSGREALGNVALLDEIDKLAARVDQLREPVSGEEVLPVLQRRLLGGTTDSAAVADVAEAYAAMVASARRAYAESAADVREADDLELELRARIRAAYPFHPTLIDVMRERWSSIDAFQRTRGALRFLATALHSLKKSGGARPLLGPADLPLRDPAVRRRLIQEVGARNDYDAVIQADIDGPNARSRRIDERLAAENPRLSGVRPASRLATAVLIYSFGGLRRGDGDSAETLPPGVTETELLQACIGPDLDYITATAALAELRNTCLYLHYDGARYCFKTDANVTKLVEDAEQEVSREEGVGHSQGPVQTKIRDLLDDRLAGRAAIVWPITSRDMDDDEPRFVIGYLPLDFVSQSVGDQERQVRDLLSRYGDRPRRYRNGIGLAVPDRKQVEALRRAVRYLLAVERVHDRRLQYRLTKDQLDQLKERRKTEESAIESALRDLYVAVWLPRIEAGELGIEKVEKGGRPLQATHIHERMIELLTGQGAPKVHTSVTPKKMIERLKLGEYVTEGLAPRFGLKVSEVVDSFYAFPELPRMESAAALKRAIVRGVAEGTIAYSAGTPPQLGADGTYEISREKVTFGQTIREDEIDLDSGFIMVAAAVPKPSASGTPPAPGTPPTLLGTGTVEAGGGPGSANVIVVPQPPTPVIGPAASVASGQVVELTFSATRDQVFKAFRAIGNLAEKSDGGEISIRVRGVASNGYDAVWIRNAVTEPLDEADIKLGGG